MSRSYEELLASIQALAENMEAVQEMGVAQYRPIVASLIAQRCREVCQIEQTLDRLLDYAAHPSGLALFKGLCRYYYTIDPAAAAEYVQIYFKVWGDEEEEDQENGELNRESENEAQQSGFPRSPNLPKLRG